MARTQKNKATEYHLGLLKAKLARYRAQLLEPTSKGGKPGEGFDVQKSGDARVALIGFPSVGKSTLLSLTTKTASEAASYEFTTLTAIPGVLEYEGVRIQLLDLPGIVEGASQGRGRGRQVVSVAKTADLILMMLDATKSTEQRRLLEYELDAVGIRLNKSKPDVVFKQKAAGGITINATVKLTKIDEKAIRTILAGYKELGLVKIYTKKRGEHPDLTDPICLRKGATIEGKSSKFSPHAQKVGLTHQVADEDVVSIFTK
ncbi:Ribosome-interacting GTPase 2 [Rhizoctonia solani]